MVSQTLSRRDVLRAGVGLAAAGLGRGALGAAGLADAGTVEVLNPRGRVPLSFFIDDSTCLVNMGHFCMPQFAEAWPQSPAYKKPWKTWPREIPDAFVREFGEFCAEHGVKGKYSVVPYPACVGWLDRELPGWSRRELLDSIKLVRELIMPRFDIHPEMISHTRVIDLKTGRPFNEINAGTMENSYPQTRKSVDELASYLAYALRILKNCDLPCEGITTPGGFGNMVKTELSAATGQAVREVFGSEIPHYFKYIHGDTESTEPRLEHVHGADTASPQLVVNIPAGTGDWFGGWEGDEQPRGHLYAADDASGGRMVEMIERGQPAVMLCHWPGLFTHGTKAGLEHFKRVVLALNGKYRDRTVWMSINEIARYWAARGLTRIVQGPDRIVLNAPFACPAFTLKISGAARPPKVRHGARDIALIEVTEARDLKPGAWRRDGRADVICFDLPKGQVTIA